MYEKYNATLLGVGGSGGEYDVQIGFGWSNGVALYYLDYYHNHTLLNITRQEDVEYIYPQMIQLSSPFHDRQWLSSSGHSQVQSRKFVMQAGLNKARKHPQKLQYDVSDNSVEEL